MEILVFIRVDSCFSWTSSGPRFLVFFFGAEGGGVAGVGGVFEVHEEVDAFHLVVADEFAEDGFGPANAGAAGDVADDDVFVF